MPRRYADYSPDDGFTWMNQLSTVGAVILAASTLPFLWNVYTTWRNAPAGHRRRPVGLRRLARVGHQLPAAAAQLHVAAADPLRAPRVRPAPPRGRRAWTTSSPNPGPLDWEADRRGESEVANERVAQRHGRAGAVAARRSSTTAAAPTRRAPDEARDQALPLRGPVLRPGRPDLRRVERAASRSAPSASRWSAASSA